MRWFVAQLGSATGARYDVLQGSNFAFRNFAFSFVFMRDYVQLVRAWTIAVAAFASLSNASRKYISIVLSFSWSNGPMPLVLPARSAVMHVVPHFCRHRRRCTTLSPGSYVVPASENWRWRHHEAS